LHIGSISLLVRDYDEACRYYINRWDLLQPKAPREDSA